ncbi:hypothetical protein COW46_02390 [Candidatus Gracilibacteria bacterium CG17_big_fil_post_rev_8_21_14_2_50_48_13]|nr:MAG: hypothetical protein COW46_02390 [Candidatus Gracilibacteria bacterium CG17_big_fil_post_rev_8_21_14_2_50_48_13]
MPRLRRYGSRQATRKHPSYYLLPLGISILVVILVTVAFNVYIQFQRIQEQALRSEPIAKVSVETDNVAVIFNGERTNVYKGYTVDWNNDEGFETGEGAQLQIPLSTGDHLRLDSMSTAFGKRDEGRSVLIGFQKGNLWLRSEKAKPEREATLLRMNYLRFAATSPVTVALGDTETEETLAVLSGSLPVMITDTQGKVLRNVVVGVGQQIRLSAATATANAEDAPLEAIPLERMTSSWFTWNTQEDLAMASYEGGPASNEETNPAVPKGAITFANLAPGSTFRSKTLELEGTYMPEEVTSMTINGVPAKLASETKTWRAGPITFADAGTQTLTISYVRADGSEVAFGTREITIDESAPEKPTLESPKNTDVSSANVQLSGRVAEGTARVVINDYELKKFSLGNTSWVYYLNAGDNMAPGVNTYSVVAIDKVGNKSEPLLITINYTPGAMPEVTSNANANTSASSSTTTRSSNQNAQTAAPTSSTTPKTSTTTTKETITPKTTPTVESTTLTPTQIRSGSGSSL